MVYNQKTPSLETGKPGHWFNTYVELAVRAWGIHLASLHLCVFSYNMRVLAWMTHMVLLTVDYDFVSSSLAPPRLIKTTPRMQK